MQTGSIGANEHADRAGAAGQSGHACCGMPLRSMHGGTAACRRAAPAGEPAAVAWRPSAGRDAPRPIAPQIVLHVAGNTRRFCVLSGAE